ncbi:MAG: putative MFS family arabinose efflux permease [Polaribacter sp.]|jgi:predicted MFS family arabinose efflux permease
MSETDKSIESNSNSIQPVSSLYRNYVLMMLTIVYVFNFVDRQILVVLQESIKNELGLSDTQLGLLSGLSFALFYVLLGIPIARLADRSNRRNIVAISLTVWSVMTAVCGFAQSFYHLLLARIGVGVGEAGASPPAHSMISDYFPENQRAKALSIYSVGIYLGIMIGFPLGSYLDDLYGWRIAFLAIGLPGVIFAILFFLTVKEPARTLEAKSTDSTESFKAVCKYLLSKKSFVFLALAAGFHTFASYGLGNWLASFIIRLHLPTGGIEAGNIGLTIGLILGIAGGAGSFIGGYFADKLGQKDKTWYFKVSAYGGIVAIPFLIVFYFYANTFVALTCLFIGYIFISTFLGPSVAIAHSIVPAKMRAFTSAVLFLALNLIGLGFGPLFVGFVSDLLAPSMGVESLRWAMASTLFFSVLAIYLFLKASKYIDEDLKSV